VIDTEKAFFRGLGPLGGSDLYFCSSQPGARFHCETTDTGLVYRMVCWFTPQLSLALILHTGWMARLS